MKSCWIPALLVISIGGLSIAVARGDEPATRLYVKTEPAAAKVLIDGHEAGISGSLLPVAPGRHAIRIEKAGFEPVERQVDAPASEITRLELTLTAAPAAGRPGAVGPGVSPATAPDATAGADASESAARYLRRARLAGAVAAAMQTVLRQHPSQTQWGGGIGGQLFAIAARKLPEGALRERATPAMLELAHALAVNELLTDRTLLQNYADAGLTDATTLHQAVAAVSGELVVTGSVAGMESGAETEGNYAVAFVLADASALHARLRDPAAMDLAKRSYRDVMHAQARELMARGNWTDALLLWRHLYQRKLVSPSLYLDATICFHKLGKDEDAVALLSEALDAFSPTASERFLESAGDLAIDIKNPAAQALAERAYHAASEKLLNEVTPRPATEPQ